MKFSETLNFINKKVDEYSLPYFECVVMHNNKRVFEYHLPENDKNTVLKMYSMSKPITAVALMQLVEKGIVKTDDFVSKYLNGYTDLFLKQNGEKVQKPIQIHHLLTMTSGLDYDFSRHSIKNMISSNPSVGTVELASCFATDGLLFEPGERFNYSTSMDVVAAIIEVASGLKFSQYVKENIFEPLGMNNSTFENHLHKTFNLNDEYLYKNKHLIKADELYDIFHPTFNYESGGAGLISDVNDYSLFVNSLACDEKLLKKSSIDTISTLYVPNTPFDDSINEYSKNNKEYGYGYGVRVRKKVSKNGIPVGEFGWDGATGSYCLCDRKNHVSIVIGLNVQMWPSYLKDFHIKLAELIYSELFK